MTQLLFPQNENPGEPWAELRVLVATRSPKLSTMKLAMLGLGEESSVIARTLVARGVEVVAYEPSKPKFPLVPVLDSIEAAVSQADVVFSLSSTLTSLNNAKVASTALHPGALYCDLNSSTPDLKKRLQTFFPEGCFVDVAIMGSVQQVGQKVPMSVSGSGAERFIQTFETFGLDLTYVSDHAGDAAARGQIRSLLTNAIAAVIIDVLWAAKALGMEQWALDEIQSQLESNNHPTVQQYLDAVGSNAKRLSVELGDTVELLASAGYDSTMLNGIAATLSKAMHNIKIPFANLEE
jgi:L-threonate 2-dehydrogenase